jgi:hypothetical protein
MDLEEKELDNRTEQRLWDELKLLQPIIDKFDRITFQIKNWFITTFVAVTGFAIAQGKQELLFLSLFLIFAFYFFEITYRAPHAFFLKRNREIELILRDRKVTSTVRGPDLNMYRSPNDETLRDSWVFKIARGLGIPEARAEESAKGARDIFPELRNMLVQPRVSFIYLLALVVNFIVAVFLNNWKLVALYILVVGFGIWAYLTARPRGGPA